MALALDIKQSHVLSERMLQSVRILQMTSQDLMEYVNELALENPAMEVQEKPPEGPGESMDRQQRIERIREEYSFSYQRQSNDDDFDPKNEWNMKTASGEELFDHLWQQILTEPMTQAEEKIIRFMLESLDEKGYLTCSTGEIAAHFGVEEEVVAGILERLQALDPPGICARDLRECLVLQLRAQGLLDDTFLCLIENCLELAARKKYPAIARRLGISAAKAGWYCELLSGLDPKPGSALGLQTQVQYIVPEITVAQFGDSFDLVLNDALVPEVRVDQYYKKMKAETDSEEVKEYLAGKIRQVEWVRQCITQRGSTLTRVAQEILRCQEDFFRNGPEYLHPLRLTDVAQALQVHDSTVSRAVNNKYLRCSWGVYPLSYFFQRNATAHTGGFAAGEPQVNTNSAVKRAIREIIEGENKQKPLSDQAISELLTGRGMSISRRTVAKYRDEEGIPDTRGRKHYE